jgi:hypothetical protein
MHKSEWLLVILALVRIDGVLLNKSVASRCVEGLVVTIPCTGETTCYV